MTAERERVPRFIAPVEPSPTPHIRLTDFPSPGAVTELPLASAADADHIIGMLERFKAGERRRRARRWIWRD